MTKKELWNLFRITGKIDYYLKFKEIEKRRKYAFRRS